MTDADWQAVVSWGAAGREGPATVVPWLRRMEVEMHHVDLDLDYTLGALAGGLRRADARRDGAGLLIP